MDAMQDLYLQKLARWQNFMEVFSLPRWEELPDMDLYVDQVVTLVRSGIPMSQALREVDGLQKKLASTILVGEESGRLDVMLDSIALSMEADAEEATKRMVTLMEPLLIVFMALIVGFIMIAVMLPIYQSYSAIENS